MKHSIVSRITEGAFRYQAWPTVAKAEDGTLYVGASGHRLSHVCPFGKNLMYVSHDEGETWSAPQIIHDSYLDDRDVGLVLWGEGNILMLSFNHPPETFDQWEIIKEGVPHYMVATPLAKGMREIWKTLPKDELLTGPFTCISRDGGKTWSKPRPCPVTNPHGPIRLEDGTLFLFGTLSSAAKEIRANDDVYVYTSHDDGETWEYLSKPSVPKGADKMCCEPYAIKMANGDILGAVRYQDKETIPGKMKIYTAISHDNGKTWDEAHFLDQDQLGAPPHMLQHSSGAVVLVYSRRFPPMGQYARVSFDFGKTWSKDVLISPEAPDWDHGYPSSVELKNGDIFTVFYQKCPGDDYNSLHSVRWNISEIL